MKPMVFFFVSIICINFIYFDDMITEALVRERKTAVSLSQRTHYIQRGRVSNVSLMSVP